MLKEANMTERRPEIEKILAGDNKAFTAFIERYQRLVSHIVFRIIQNDEDRRDICQDVFIKIHKNLATFRGDSKMSTWIGRVTYNHCLNFLEKKKLPLYEDLCGENETIDSVIDNTQLPDEFAEKQELSAHLREEIDKLPVQFRAIVTLYHLDEMSYTEIGKIMKMPDGTVKSYLFRARKLLKDRLQTRFRGEEL